MLNSSKFINTDNSMVGELFSDQYKISNGLKVISHQQFHNCESVEHGHFYLLFTGAPDVELRLYIQEASKSKR